MAHSYDVGTRAWQPDPTEGWVASEVESKTVDGDRVKLVFRLDNGEVNHLFRLTYPLKLTDDSPDKKLGDNPVRVT